MWGGGGGELRTLCDALDDLHHLFALDATSKLWVDFEGKQTDVEDVMEFYREVEQELALSIANMPQFRIRLHKASTTIFELPPNIVQQLVF